MIVQFFRAKYKAMPEPSNYYFVPEGQPPMQSPCGAIDARAYHYCPADRSIYLGQASMWSYYDEDGDAAPAIGLAHEWGHHVQQVSGVPEPRDNIESVNHENQADCIAGGWIQYAEQQNWIEQQDYASTDRLVAHMASSEPTRDHGNLQERSNSMNLGYRSGLQACNSFYSATPIIVS